jgi:nucleotide-binding universal stress UspA family protein
VPGRIVVGIDGSESGDSDTALRFAYEEAAARTAQLEVIHAWVEPYRGPRTNVSVPRSELELEAAELLDVAIERVLAGRDDRGRVRVHPRLVEDAPAHALIEASDGADMLVVGSRGRGGFAGLLLGSVSQQVVHHAHCPVTVVRKPQLT